MVALRLSKHYGDIVFGQVQQVLTNMSFVGHASGNVGKLSSFVLDADLFSIILLPYLQRKGFNCADCTPLSTLHSIPKTAVTPGQYARRNQQLVIRDIVDIGLFALESALSLTPKQRDIACVKRLSTFSNTCCRR